MDLATCGHLLVPPCWFGGHVWMRRWHEAYFSFAFEVKMVVKHVGFKMCLDLSIIQQLTVTWFLNKDE